MRKRPRDTNDLKTLIELKHGDERINVIAVAYSSTPPTNTKGNIRSLCCPTVHVDCNITYYTCNVQYSSTCIFERSPSFIVFASLRAVMSCTNVQSLSAQENLNLKAL